MGDVLVEPMSENVKSLLRRNRPGSKRADWCNWPDQEFHQMESIHAQQMLIQVLLGLCPSLDVTISLSNEFEIVASRSTTF